MVDSKLEGHKKEIFKYRELEKKEKDQVYKRIVDDQHKEVKRLEESFMSDLEDRVKLLMRKSEECVQTLSEKLQISIDQLYKRVGRNENQVVELIVTTEQAKAFKKRKVEMLEKEQLKIHEIITGKLWVKIQNLEGDQRCELINFKSKVDKLEKDLQSLREPLLKEGKTLLQQNEAYAREMSRM